MSFGIEALAAEVTPPITNSIVAVNCTTAATVLDMTTFPASVFHGGKDPKQGSGGVVGKYVRITAQGGDLYFAFSLTYANANTINTTSYSTVNATTGKITPTNLECDYIPAGSFKDIYVSSATMPTGSAGPNTPLLPGTPQANGAVNSVARYLGIVASVNGTIARIYQSSR